MRVILLLLPALALGAAYQYVQHEIASGGSRITLPQTSTVLAPFDWSKANIGMKIDTKELQRLNSENIVRQIEANNRRMQDFAAYARNPAGWHGMPPH
jgi:hypothetical protein